MSACPCTGPCQCVEADTGIPVVNESGSALYGPSSILSFGADPTGNFDSTPAFLAAFAYLNNKGTVYIPGGTFSILNNLTVPAGVTLSFWGGVLNVGTGKTLGIDGAIAASDAKIFGGAGTVAWSSTAYRAAASVSWFGATGNGTSDDTAAIQACITAMQAVTSGSTVNIPLGTYKVTSTLELNAAASCWVRGGGLGTVLAWSGTAGQDVVLLLNCYYCKISDLVIQGNNGAAPYAGIESRVDTTQPNYPATGVTHNTFENLIIGASSSNNMQYGIIYTKATAGADNGNDLGFLKRVSFQNVEYAAFSTTHAQSKAHMLLDCDSVGGQYGVQTTGGSFNCYGGYYSLCSVAAFGINASDDNIAIHSVGSESCNRFLYTPNAAADAWAVTVQDCRIACDALNADGNLFLFKFSGPLSIVGCTTDSGTVLAQVSTNATNPARLIITGNYFGQTNASSQSFVGSLAPSGSTVVQYGNVYANNSGLAALRNDPLAVDGVLSVPALAPTRAAYGITAAIAANVGIAAAVAGGITLTLPSAVSVGQELVVSDEDGNASSSNITVAPPASGTIDGSGSSKTISSNYGVLRFYAISTLAWKTM